MRRKAQATTLIAVMGIGFISIGTYLGSITLTDTLSETVQINSGDVSVVMETKVRSEHYPERMSHSLRYVYNTSTYQLGQNGGGYSEWTENSPTREQLESQLQTDILEKLQERNRVAACTKPEIESVQATRQQATAELEGSIKCTGSNTAVTMPVPDSVTITTINNFYYGYRSEQVAGSIIHNYGLIGGGLKLRETIDEEVEQQDFQDKMTGTCGESYSSIRDDLREDTENEASDYYSSLSFEEVEDDLIDRISFDVSSEISSASHDTEQTSSVRCQEDCITAIQEQGGSGGCVPVYDDRLTLEDTYTPTGIDWDILLEDNQQVLTADGEKTLQLDFVFSQSLSG